MTQQTSPTPARATPPKDTADVLKDGVAADVTNRELLAWMFRFVAPVKGMMTLCAAYLIIIVAIDVLMNWQAGRAVDEIKNAFTLTDAASPSGFWAWIFSQRPDAHAVRWAVGLLCGLVGLMSVFRYIREVANMRMSMEMVFHIRQAVYDKLQRVGWGFHDSISSGQLINRALSDLQNVRAFIQTAVLTSLEMVLYVAFNILIILTISPWVALLALAPLPAWTWYILRFSQRVQPAAKAVMEAEDKNVSLITENIAGVHVVKAFATEKHEIDKYNANIETFRARVLLRIRMFADFQPVVRAIASASHLSLFFLAGFLLISAKKAGVKSNMTVGGLLILSGAMNQILGRLQQVSTINEQYQNAIVSARRLYEILAAKATVPEKADALVLPPGVGAVTFENVSFGYDPDKPVIKDLSFQVKGGSVVAIVGPTGAGKSTMVNLIARFYDPQQGRVLLDGIDLRELRLDTLRPQISFVFQETYLFSDTVAANISYGRPGITRGEIEAASRLAQAHEFIEGLTKQYGQMLGERGSSLSGGQKQRLAIARAIVTNPRILILDDATASVDPETEDLIRRGMKLVMHGRTTFVIAHRISTVKQADLVLVIENGRITQSGTHAQLMAEDGHYREIADVQLARDDEDDAPKVRKPDPADNPSHMKRVSDQQQVTLTKQAVQEAPSPEPAQEESPA